MHNSMSACLANPVSAAQNFLTPADHSQKVEILGGESVSAFPDGLWSDHPQLHCTSAAVAHTVSAAALLLKRRCCQETPFLAKFYAGTA